MHQNLAAHRLVVPDPASTFSIAQNIWPLTQAQLDMGTIAQQQAARKVNIDHIRDSGNILRTDGCYCTTPRKDLARRLHHGEISGPPTKCHLYKPKAPLSIAQLRHIFQRSPANLVAEEVQDSLHEPASRIRRTPTPPPTAVRAVPKPKPYGHVPNSQGWDARTDISAAHRYSNLWLTNNLMPHSRPC